MSPLDAMLALLRCLPPHTQQQAGLAALGNAAHAMQMEGVREVTAGNGKLLYYIDRGGLAGEERTITYQPGATPAFNIQRPTDWATANHE